jgi:hypothetical protein
MEGKQESDDDDENGVPYTQSRLSILYMTLFLIMIVSCFEYGEERIRSLSCVFDTNSHDHLQTIISKTLLPICHGDES